MSTPGDNQLAKRNVAVLICAQAILGSQMPMIFTVGGLAGQSLASNACFATLPISMIVLGSMLTASPLSNLMQKFYSNSFCPRTIFKNVSSKLFLPCFFITSKQVP